MGRAYNSRLSFFTDSDKAFMEWFARARHILYLPFLRFFTYCRITPSIVSFLGFISILLFLYVYYESPIWSLTFLALYIFFDGLDGTLARYQRRDDVSGAFIDMVVDHSALVIILIAILLADIVSPVMVFLYGVLYLIMIMFAVIMSLQGAPLYANFRTKSILIVLFVIWVIWQKEWFTYLFWIAIPLMVINCLYRFIVIYHSLKGQRW